MSHVVSIYLRIAWNHDYIYIVCNILNANTKLKRVDKYWEQTCWVFSRKVIGMGVLEAEAEEFSILNLNIWLQNMNDDNLNDISTLASSIATMLRLYDDVRQAMVILPTLLVTILMKNISSYQISEVISYNNLIRFIYI